MCTQFHGILKLWKFFFCLLLYFRRGSKYINLGHNHMVLITLAMRSSIRMPEEETCFATFMILLLKKVSGFLNK